LTKDFLFTSTAKRGIKVDDSAKKIPSVFSVAKSDKSNMGASPLKQTRVASIQIKVPSMFPANSRKSEIPGSPMRKVVN